MDQSLIQYGLFCTFALLGGGSLLSLWLGARREEASAWSAAHIAGVLGGIFGLATSLAVLLSGATISVYSGIGVGIIPDIWSIRIDGLAAIFLAAISTVAISASLFGMSSGKQYLGVYRLGHFGLFYTIFLASMFLVIAANNAILFLFAWELMAISSYFLVVFERREQENIGAGTLYLLISQMGAAFLFAAFLVLYRFTGSWDFDVIRTTTSSLPIVWQNVALAFALIGFASKAGVIPLHIWLPKAHPAAPSHVSALMSGVMIKTAIFMIIRFFVDFFPTPHVSWGVIILILGAISSLLGVLYALSEHDIKRLLAFHSVENIGIILLGIGAAIIFFSLGMPLAGVGALVAALYHTVNHALFKALLFLSAGSVVHATHTRNMEEYGGLIRVMPWTAFFFLIGAVAISGLPPFNGFVSEWLTFQSLFAGIVSLPVFLKLTFLVGASSLAFTGGLAAACFVKAFGAIFLARPRHAMVHAHESGSLPKWAMGMLATLCALFGLAASTIAPILGHVAEVLRGSPASPIPIVGATDAIRFTSTSLLSMTSVAAALLLGIALIYALVSIRSARTRTTVSRTWDCGSPLTPRMEITATGFSRSLITIFRGLLRPTTQTDVEYHDATMRYFPKAKAVHLSLPDLYHIYLYLPAAAFIERTGREARRIQTGNLNTYLLYMFVTLGILLYWALK